VRRAASLDGVAANGAPSPHPAHARMGGVDRGAESPLCPWERITRVLGKAASASGEQIPPGFL
jgi:hypothetical protein